MKGTCACPCLVPWCSGAAVVVQGGGAGHQQARHHQQQLTRPAAGEPQRPARTRHGRPQRGGAALPADRQLSRPGRGGGAGRGVRQQVGGGDQEAAALLALALRLHPPDGRHGRARAVGPPRPRPSRPVLHRPDGDLQHRLSFTQAPQQAAEQLTAVIPKLVVIFMCISLGRAGRWLVCSPRARVPRPQQQELYFQTVLSSTQSSSPQLHTVKLAPSCSHRDYSEAVGQMGPRREIQFG